MVSDNTSGSRGQKDRRLISKKKSNGDESKWPHFTDDDYIVFCFGEDGELDVVKDDNNKSESSNRVEYAIANSPRPRNRKLTYDANAETISKLMHDEVVCNEIRDELNPRNEKDFMKSDERVIEEEIISTRSGSGRIDTGDQNDEYYDESETTVSGDDSSYSNESDISRGSFAFPILGWEWTGSPVQMPKSEGRHLRKHKVRFLPFQCFRSFDKN